MVLLVAGLLSGADKCYQEDFQLGSCYSDRRRGGLQKEVGADGKPQSTLKSLSTFLTLQKAEERGFDAGKYGLTSDQAAEIATVFSRRAS